MATKFLDKSGLSYFWTKIKSYVAGLLALKADDSNVVHKTGNESISGTKTFNSQIVGTIGKSVSNDNYFDMVQTFQSDNNEYRSCTIRCTNGDGYNSISIGVHDESNNAANGLVIRNTAGTLTGDFNGSLRLIRTTDAQGTEDNSPALSIGSTSGTHLELDGNEIMAKASGTTVGPFYINAQGGDVYIGGNTANYKSVTGRGKGSSTVPVYTNANGIVTACGSSLDVDVSGNAATATKLATSKTINGVSFDGSANIIVEDSTKVSKSGDEMTGNLTVKKSVPQIILRDPSLVRGTAPESNYTGLEILGRDYNNRTTWALYHTYETDKTNRIRLLCYNGLTTDNTYAEIGVGYDSSGNPFTNAPTPSSTTDNTTKIATTKWVRNATGNFACNAATATKATQDGSGNTITYYYCTLSTGQTVSGNKTFSGKVAIQNGITGINKDNVVESANNLCLLGAADVGKKQVYYTTVTGYTKLTDIPSTVATTIESYTVRRNGETDWVVNQILHNTSSKLYFRHGYGADGGMWSDWKTFAFTDSDITGNAATATKLATARTINGVSFDGSANIMVADSTKVAKSGDTMTGDLTISKSLPRIFVKDTSIARGTAPDSNVAVPAILGQDNNGKTTWTLHHNYSTDKSNRIRLLCYNGLTTDSTYAEISIGYDSSGNPYTVAPTPSSTTDSTTKIATTAWVRTATGNFACNAATATAFASSKTVELTGAVTGTVSSTGGWTVPTLWRYCQLGRTDSSTSNPWYKVASCRLGGGSISYGIVFFIENCNTTNKFSGILHMSVSTDSNGMISSGNTVFRWVANNGFSPEDFVLVCPDTAYPTVEVWARFAAGYLRRRFTVISEGTQNGASVSWTLYNTVSAGQEASIPTAGTQVASSPSLLEQRVKALEDAMQ